MIIEQLAAPITSAFTQHGTEIVGRPYGGSLIFHIEKKPKNGYELLISRLLQWFARRDESRLTMPLMLFTKDHPATLEVNDLAAHCLGWAYPGQVLVYYDEGESGNQGHDSITAKSLKDQYLPTALGMPRRALSRLCMQSMYRPESLTETDAGLLATYFERPSSNHDANDLAIDIEWRCNELLRVKGAVQSLSGIADDVMDVLVAYVLMVEPEPDGSYVIDLDSILAARESKKRTKGTQKYSNGYSPAAREAVALAILDLEAIVYTAYEYRLGRKKIGNHQRIMTVNHVISSIENGQPSIRKFSDIDPKTWIAVNFRMGSWFHCVRTMFASQPLLASRSIIAYDARRQSPQKRLGRYLTQRQQEACDTGRIVRTVRAIFDDLLWMPEASGPKATRRKLEGALQALLDDGVILDWGYDEEQAILPAHGWLELWMEHHLWVVLPFPEYVHHRQRLLLHSA